MANKKSMKSALLTSSISLLLCFAMLLGTTFAWFTDSVTSANNIIKSGNLDVEFEYWNGSTWETVQGASDILTNDLWEPGVTEVAYLRVANKGSLALKYQLGVNIVSEKEGTNVAGDTFKLSDSLMFGVVEGVTADAYSKDDAGRAEAIAALTDAKKISAGYTNEAQIEANDTEDYFALVVYMPTTVGNEANHNGTDVPQIDLGINVFATQMENEEDSFSNNYDADADEIYPEAKTVTVPENNTSDIEISAGSLTVTVPEDAAAAGDVYKIVVSNTNNTTNATGETTVGFDLTMYKNETKVSGDGTVYEVEWNIGAEMIISEVTHNGTALTKADTGADQTYKYDSATGVLTVYTESFSPFAVTYKEFENNFADNSWNAIIRACQKNSVPATWNVGDTKTMTIGDAAYKIAIIGKNHDAYSDGSGKAPLTFQVAELCGTAAMNAEQTNATGWVNSKMRTTTMAEKLEAMPSEVKNAVKAVNKETLKSDGSGLETTSDKLFVLSLFEVYGSTFYSNGYEEGATYDYYSNKENRQMGASWWLRGPGINNGKNNGIGFTQINQSGLMANGSAEYASGVVFGFCF